MNTLLTYAREYTDPIVATQEASKLYEAGETEAAIQVLEMTLQINFDVRAIILLSRYDPSRSVSLLKRALYQIDDLYPMSATKCSGATSTDTKVPSRMTAKYNFFYKNLKIEYNYVLSEIVKNHPAELTKRYFLVLLRSAANRNMLDAVTTAVLAKMEYAAVNAAE
jgi:hypothetical protein